MNLENTLEKESMNLVRTLYVQLNENCLGRDPYSPIKDIFLSKDTEGPVIDLHSVNLIPNLSTAEREKIVGWELIAKDIGELLVIIGNRVVSVHVSHLEYTGIKPCSICHSMTQQSTPQGDL